MFRQPRRNLRGLYRAQWQRVDAEPRRFQLVDNDALVRFGRLNSGERRGIIVEHLLKARVALSCVSALQAIFECA